MARGRWADKILQGKDAVTCPHLRGGGGGEKEFRERDEKEEWEKQRGDVKESDQGFF